MGFDVYPSTYSRLFMQFFIASQFVGGVGLFITVTVTWLSKGVHRQATWVSFCLSWVLSAISYTLLAMFNQNTAEEPAQGLCFVQAVLIYGAPVLTGFTTFSLVFELWMHTRSTHKPPRIVGPTVPVIWLLVTPYLLYVVALVCALLVGIHHENSVERLGSRIYCVNTTGIPGTVSGILVIIAMILTLCTEFMVASRLYRIWKAYGGVRDAGHLPSLFMLVRIIVFTVFTIVAIGTSVAFAFQSTKRLPELCIALMPLIAFLVFGIQKDIWCSCCMRATNRLSLAQPRYTETPRLLEITPRTASFELD